VLVVLACGLLSSAAGARKSSHHKAGHSKNATLQLVLGGVAQGARAHMVLSGPHGIHRTIVTGARQVTIKGLRAGRYNLAAQQYTIGLSHNFPAGGVGFALPAKYHAKLRAGHKTVLVVFYNIRSGALRQSTPQPTSVVFAPNSTDPTSLVLPASANPQVGQFIYYPPSAQFPNGVFSKVTGVSPGSGGVSVSLAPASLLDAFPEINVAETIPIGNPPAGAAVDAFTGRPIARAADLTVSLSKDPFECGTSGGTLGLPIGFSPSLDAEIHRPLFGSLTARFVIGLTGSIGLDLSLPEGTSCSVEFAKAGPWPIGDIPIGPIQIPVEAEVSGKAIVGLSGPLEVHAHASLTTHVGFTYDSGMHGVFDATPSGSVSAHFGGGKVEVGPELKISAGLADTLDANVSAGLFDTVEGSGTDEYDYGVTFSADAGLEATGVGSVSQNLVEKFFRVGGAGGGYKVPNK
jgi:hypothetical protein